jgi:hypothetical protein
VKKQFAARSTSIDILSNADKRNAALFQTVDDLDQVPQTSSEPVELPDDQRIAFTGKINGGFQTDALTWYWRLHLHKF